MKNKYKALLLALCAVTLVATSILGTMAYLTDDEVATNTFTVGQVGLKLDEARVNKDGTYVTDHENRVQSNEYHLIPGRTYFKDPTVTVDKGSEDAYVRMLVKVENIDQLKKALPNVGETAKYYASNAAGNSVFLLQMFCVDHAGTCTWDETSWKMYDYKEYKAEDVSIDTPVSSVTGSAVGDTGVYEFRYKEVVKKSENQATVLPDLFTHITVPGEIDNEHIKYLEKVRIVVNAQAIQADGFADAEAAWQVMD